MVDYLIVGSGLFGSVMARELTRQGRTVLVLEKSPEVAGMIRTSEINGIQVHLHGPHIFHSGSQKLWNYVNAITPFRPYIHRAKAIFQGRQYTLPFNLSTIQEVSGCDSPEEAKKWLLGDLVPCEAPRNLEEHALSQVGKTIYERLIRGYTKKQWGRDPKDLPASIIKRIPVRDNYDDNYFSHKYQGIPEAGFTRLIENILDGVDVRCNADFKDVSDWRKVARKLVYSGPIDELFDYRFGHLEYRSLRFEHEVAKGDFQGRSVVNYTEEEVPYTRIVEHKHFTGTQSEFSVITREYPVEWKPGLPRYYPVNDEINNARYEEYRALVQPDMTVAGRLGGFKYFDMDQIIAMALKASRSDILSPF